MDSLKGTLTPMKVLNGTLNGGIAYGTFNYNELENKPSINGNELVGNVNIPIPTKTSDLTNDSGFITDADIPTKTSELTNDSGFITSADIPTIPTNTSQLNNDSGFLTMNTTPVRSVNSQTGDVNLFIPNATSQLNNDAGFLTESSQKITDIEDDIDTLQGDVSDLTNLVVKSIFLTTTYACSYADNNTIGYRGTGPNITTLTGYPTGKNVLAVVIERSYVGSNIYSAITNLDGNVLYTESKNSGTAYIGMKILYTD